MGQLITYWGYFFEYLKFKDYRSIVTAVRYVLFNTSHREDRIIETSIGVFFCRKNTNDFQFANLKYEWDVKKFILKRKDEFSVFIDAGSCIGDYCILLAKMNKKCFAFEPIPENVSSLTKNMELNHLQKKVKVFPYGLGHADYQTSYSYDPLNTGASRINKIRRGSTVAEIRKLDNLMDELSIGKAESVFIKLDLEGMEIEAIHGAAGFIRKYPKITFIIEDKHSGQFPIKDSLSEIAVFEFGTIDHSNMYAKKIRNF